MPQLRAPRVVDGLVVQETVVDTVIVDTEEERDHRDMTVDTNVVPLEVDVRRLPHHPCRGVMEGSLNVSDHLHVHRLPLRGIIRLHQLEHLEGMKDIRPRVMAMEGTIIRPRGQVQGTMIVERLGDLRRLRVKEEAVGNTGVIGESPDAGQMSPLLQENACKCFFYFLIVCIFMNVPRSKLD